MLRFSVSCLASVRDTQTIPCLDGWHVFFEIQDDQWLECENSPQIYPLHLIFNSNLDDATKLDVSGQWRANLRSRVLSIIWTGVCKRLYKGGVEYDWQFKESTIRKYSLFQVAANPIELFCGMCMDLSWKHQVHVFCVFVYYISWF